MQNYWVARQNIFCYWQCHCTYCKFSCDIFIFIYSKQKCWQCICSRYIQQNSVLTSVSGKNGNSSICISGRLQVLLNQTYQFHTDFYHNISTIVYSKLVFLTQADSQAKSFSRQSHCY